MSCYCRPKVELAGGRIGIGTFRFRDSEREIERDMERVTDRRFFPPFPIGGAVLLLPASVADAKSLSSGLFTVSHVGCSPFDPCGFATLFFRRVFSNQDARLRNTTSTSVPL